jgi:REP element-mobilizing transposase RayT
MANTYTQLYIHCVFAVKYRASMLQAPWDEEVRRYITGIIQNAGHKMIAINNVADHLHLFVGLHPTDSVSKLMQLVKGDSSEFINKQGWTRSRFSWQEGYGAFSHSRSQVSAVAGYIAAQQEHHRKKTFQEEYRKMLTDFGIAFDEQYLFKEPA